MQSPTSKLILALLLSLALHGLLLLIKGEPVEQYLSKNSIIHARLDKQDRELIQQEQTGQIAKQHNEKISQASSPSQATADQPLEQEASKADQAVQDEKVISTQSRAEEKIAPVSEQTPLNETQDTEIEELVEKTEVAATTPTSQQESQISSDSRAQVEALDGSEDPTYTSYRRIATQYLQQRLEAKAGLKGRVRLKIKLEYGSFATSVNIVESSGDLDVDSWAKKAALAANPYPKIPKEIGSTFEFSPTLQLGQTKP